ncbi:MAG: formylglycine-generating enzyme family protein [Bacteroidales bacterium]|nr:formylglycine-generating enzyme family protein [Bacteroidales bacterium]
MRPKILLTSLLAIVLSSGTVDASAAEKTYETESDVFKFEEWMKKAQKSFDCCDYQMASTCTRRAKVGISTENLIQRADSLLALATECEMYRDSAVYFRKRRHFSKAHIFYGNVVMRNSKDRDCRNGYDTCYLFSIDKFANMSLMKAGSYTVGRNNGPYCEGPQHSVKLSAYMMDNREVSVADYVVYMNTCQNMVEGHPCVDITNPECHVKEVGGWFVPEKGFEDFPITCVSYYGAYFYAKWLGKDLPTEYQFEAAWGKNSIDCNHSQSVMPANCGAPNEYNIMNLHGNVAEWCDNWYDASLHRNDNGKQQQKRQSSVNIDELKSVRGCAYDSPKDIDPKTFREGLSPLEMYTNVGFRCVINL